MFTRTPSLPRALFVGAFVITATMVGSALLSSWAAASKTAEANNIVVVELFTSQGCSSCPPADKVLSELSERDNVIALSLPVTYWDNLGWPDTFASPTHTSRQRAYAKSLNTHQVYTPQMVINGRIDVVGSRRGNVLDYVDGEAQAIRNTITIDLDTRNEALAITLGDAPEALQGVDASVWILPYHSGAHEVSIKRGENRGRTLAYSNVVDGMMKLGMYDGTATQFTHSLAMLEHKNVDDCVILVQRDDTGEIIGAQKIALAEME